MFVAHELWVVKDSFSTFTTYMVHKEIFIVRKWSFYLRGEAE